MPLQDHPLGPEIPITSGDTAAVMLRRWSAIDTLDRGGCCVVTFVVRSRRGSADTLILLRVSPRDSDVVHAQVNRMDIGGPSIVVPAEQIPGMLRDLAISRTRELFPQLAGAL